MTGNQRNDERADPPLADSSPDDLGRRIARGAGWMVAMRWSIRLIGVVSTIILARLLSPTDFGVVAMAMLVVAFIEVLADFGFENALIQNQQATKRHFDTAWTLNVIRGLISAVLLLALAHPVATLFAEPRIEAVIAWLSLAPLFDGFKNVGVVEFRRQLWFHREYRFLVATKIISFVVTLALAIVWRSYWALVLGMITRSAAMLALSYVMHEYRPRLALSRARELFGFSVWILLNHYIHYGNRNFGRMLVGRFLDAAALGVFTLAREISGMLGSELALPMIRALFPGYSKAQDDPSKLKSLFLNTAGFMVFLSWPLGFGLAAVAEPFTLVVLGEKWAMVGPLLAYLAIAGAIGHAWGNPPSLFMAQGRPQYSTLFFAGHMVLLVTAVAVGFHLNGMTGIAQGTLVASVIRFFMVYPFIRRMIDLPLHEFLGVTWRSMVAAVLMYVVVLTVGAMSSALPLPVGLVIMVCTGVVVYPFAVLALWLGTGRPHGPEAILLAYVAEKRGWPTERRDALDALGNREG